MNTIIAATDFSPSAINAVNFAADMAKVLKCKLHLFHAYNIPVTYSEVPTVLVSADVVTKESNLLISTLKEKLNHVHSGEIEIETSCILGNTIDELEILCEKVMPFAIVMGTKGKSVLEQLTFGSTVLTAIRHLTYPVISVPPGKEFGAGIKQIGFACDFKAVESTTPIAQLKKMTDIFGAELHILNIDYNNKNFRPDTPEQSFLLHDKLKDLRPKYHFLTNKNVENGISEFAETHNLDLLIAIPKKHKLLDILFKPSTTKGLVLHSHIPVMCIHEKD